MRSCLIRSAAAVSLAMAFAAAPAARADEASVTPYGDYCTYCKAYGVCRDTIPPEEAVQALEQYYADKGYELGSVRHKGRFIEADVNKDNRQVDRVLFDRKTGRIRSIY